MTENDIRKAANKLLGKEGKDWRLESGTDGQKYIIFEQLIPVWKRVDFHLQENFSNPAERIREAIDWKLSFS